LIILGRLLRRSNLLIKFTGGTGVRTEGRTLHDEPSAGRPTRPRLNVKNARRRLGITLIEDFKRAKFLSACVRPRSILRSTRFRPKYLIEDFKAVSSLSAELSADENRQIKT